MEKSTTEGHFISVSLQGNETRKLPEQDCKTLLPSAKAALEHLGVLESSASSSVLLVPVGTVTEMKTLEEKVRDAIGGSLANENGTGISCFTVGRYSVGNAAEKLPEAKFYPDSALGKRLIELGVPAERVTALFAEYEQKSAAPATEERQNEAAA